MRVAILRVAVPFVSGGAESLTRGLARALCAAGHEVEDLALPGAGTDAGDCVVEELMAARLLRFASSGPGRIDRLIALKFPAYLAGFERKSVWLLHPLRQAYELWPTGGLAHSPVGRQVRGLVQDADRRALADAEIVRPLSHTVAGRLRHFLGLETTPLYCPPPTPELLRNEDSDGYLYLPSRLAPVKRHPLVLEALAATRHRIHLVISGREDEDGYGRSLEALAERLGVADRVAFRGHVDDAERARLYARCHAVVFAPLLEDYGFVTLEAMLSGKAVVTASDSGGPTEFVRHEQTGLVAEPSPQALAEALDRLWDDPDLARALGRAGRDAYDRAGIDWESVVAALVPGR